MAVLTEQKFTQPESACISREIRKLRDEGVKMDAAIARAIEECAPGKARSESLQESVRAFKRLMAQPREVELVEFHVQTEIKFTAKKDEHGNLIEAKLHDVKLLGTESSNVNPDGTRNRYSSATRERAIPLYEGQDINVDHPDRSTPGAERSVRDRLGWSEGVYNKADGIYARDLVMDPTDPVTKKVLWFAENNPQKLGFSHNAKGRGIVEGEYTDIQEITKVRSTDLVGKPATTKGLFESENDMASTTTQKKPAAFEIKEGKLLVRVKGKLLRLLEVEADDYAREAADSLAALLAGDMGEDDKRALLVEIAQAIMDKVTAKEEAPGEPSAEAPPVAEGKTEERLKALETSLLEMSSTSLQRDRNKLLVEAGLDPTKQPSYVLESLYSAKGDDAAQQIVADRRATRLHRDPTALPKGESKSITTVEAAAELGL